jgi:hypothetical protein
MRLSDLIKRASDLQARLGDLPVVVVDGDGEYGFAMREEVLVHTGESGEEASDELNESRHVVVIDITAEPE